MTNEQMIRELRAVAKKYEGKHVFTFETNIHLMATDAANHIEGLCDEINRQKAEIERLKTANGLFEYVCEAIHRYRDSTGKECLMDYCDAEARNKAIDEKIDELCKIQFARAEAVKEFAEGKRNELA